tara:strand:- start:390 stop:647 length:258 start_codon:yes stop_codon:yes gene_type:complete
VEVVHITQVMVQNLVDLVVEVIVQQLMEHLEQQIRDLMVVMVNHIQITFILLVVAVVLVDLVETQHILDPHIQLMHRQGLVVSEN